jgi:dihydroxyacid dehydratase/phosphogluconate dehydratase
MEDIHKIGGIPAILKYLLNNTDLIDGSQLTVTGKTMAENLVDVDEIEFEHQDVMRSLKNPIKATGHLTILRGNLAPETAVAKLTGKEGLQFEVFIISWLTFRQSDPSKFVIRALQNVSIGELCSIPDDTFFS